MTDIKLYITGGAVRDKFLGLKSKDIDYSVEAPSYEAMKKYIESQGKIYLETPEYFTIRAKMPNLGDADFVLCRKDGAYSDGRRPDEVEMGTIYDDLARRDFTINSFCIDVETNKVIDPFNGLEDLKNKIIRCTGSVERIKEDSLRMLRAIRFSITKGFSIDNSIIKILEKDYVLLYNISVERIREELLKCFEFDTVLTLNTFDKFKDLRNYIFNKFPMILKPSIIG